MKEKESNLDFDELHRMLNYDPATGDFRWKIARAQIIKPGQIAGETTNRGYRRIKIHEQKYLAHRLAWFYVHGEWPSGQVDHVNRIRHDNRLVNLRVVTPEENGQNRSQSKNNTSGMRGVSWYSRGNKWRAAISRNGKKIHLGYFSEKHDAYQAYLSAAASIHTNNNLVGAI